MTPIAHSDRQTTSGNAQLVYDILRHVPVGIYHIDFIQQRLLMVNEYLCRATGYSEQELLTANPMDILAPQSQAIFSKRLQDMAVGKKVSSELELEFILKDGRREWGKIHIHHIFEQKRIVSAYVVAHTITEQKRAQQKLVDHRQELEELVEERTGELAKTNRTLRKEIAQRTAATEKLKANSERLEELNTAMRVLLDKRSEDRLRSEELIRLNLKELIDPYLERLESSDLRNYQKQLVEVIRMNLEQVVSSATPALSSKYFMFSPNELQVVNLIRSGKTTKEMARLLNLSTRTIETYRNSIRKKLNLKHKKINLRTYLSSL